MDNLISVLPRIRFKVGIFLLSILFMSVFTYFLLFSPLVDNWRFIITVRVFLYDQIEKNSPTVFYTLMPVKVRDEDVGGVYRYKWQGWIVNMDYVNGVMTAKDKQGREWRFKFFTQASKQEGTRELMFNQQKYLTSGSSEMVVRYLKIIGDDPLNPARYFAEGDQVVLFFGDSRNTSKILKAGTSGELIELKGAGNIPIVRVVKEGVE